MELRFKTRSVSRTKDGTKPWCFSQSHAALTLLTPKGVGVVSPRTKQCLTDAKWVSSNSILMVSSG